ncbi:MAG: alpha-glucosidase [Clostridiales bacterium]|nr:alpha-glucosidase [Clostridiales bacterium]
MSEWWKKEVVYQIYPRSFCDSNGDGIGDLPGIISKLDELQKLGIGILWLSPVYASPNEDNGYDISDYCAINPEYGTMTDMEHLIAEASARGIRVIMDLVINHTSTAHPWFQASRDPQSPYRDYYYWRKGSKGKLPNNWTGFFGENCWEYDDRSDAYYLHLFAKHQADLDYHNPKVLEEIKSILRFWLDKGVAGFRCDVINILWKDSLQSSPKKMILTGSEHYLTLEGTHAILREIRKILDEYDAFTVGETVFASTKQACDLTLPERGELNTVFGFEHMECDQKIVKWLKTDFHPARLAKALSKWQLEVPWNTLNLENHDQPRSLSRFGSARYPIQSAKLLATLLFTLRGTPFIYQGQEIGMTNFDFTSMEQVQDVESKNVDRLLQSFHIPKKQRWRMIARTSRDNARTPMQWNTGKNAGFTAGNPWLGVNSNYRFVNYASQQENPSSLLHYYEKLIALRRGSETLLSGTYCPLKITDEEFSYRRAGRDGSYTIVLNFSDKPLRVPYEGNLVLSNYGYNRYDGILQPCEAVILRERS